jgi:small subunit ribosomal protein S8e
MTQWHEKSKRKNSGGLRNSINRATRYLSQKGDDFTRTTLSETPEIKVSNGRGLTTKYKLRKAAIATITNQKNNKTQKMKIVWVHENDANRLYVRRNIITKGTLIEAQNGEEKVFARVTSRPGQDGMVNAITAEAPKEKKKTSRGKRKQTSKKTAPKKAKTEENTPPAEAVPAQ